MFVENFFFHVFDLSFFTRQRNVQSACTVSKIRDFLQDFSKFRGKWSELIFRIEKTERGKLHGNIRNPGKVHKNIQDVIIAEYDIVSMEKKNLILSRTMAPKQKKWKGKRFFFLCTYKIRAFPKSSGSLRTELPFSYTEYFLFVFSINAGPYFNF